MHVATSCALEQEVSRSETLGRPDGLLAIDMHRSPMAGNAEDDTTRNAADHGHPVCRVWRQAVSSSIACDEINACPRLSSVLHKLRQYCLLRRRVLAYGGFESPSRDCHMQQAITTETYTNLNMI